MQMRMAWMLKIGTVALLAAAILLPQAALAQQEPEAQAARVTIQMRNTAFEPQLAMIAINGTVVWTNGDPFAHDVFGVNESFNSTGGPGGMAAGATYERKLDKAGVYDYYCTVHSTGRGNSMWGRLIVVEPPVLQPAGGEGVSPEKTGVRWLAHWVGVISFIAVFAVLILYYFVLKYGETVHATDHRDRKEK